MGLWFYLFRPRIGYSLKTSNAGRTQTQEVIRTMNTTNVKTLEIAEIVKTIGLSANVSTKDNIKMAFKLQNDPILSSIYREQYYSCSSERDIMKIDLQRTLYLRELVERELKGSDDSKCIFNVFLLVLKRLITRQNLFITGYAMERLTYEPAEGGYYIHENVPQYFVAFTKVSEYRIFDIYVPLLDACEKYFGEAIHKEFTFEDHPDFSSGFDFVQFMLKQFFEQVIELTGNEDGKEFKQSREASWLEPDYESGGYIDHMKWSYNSDQPMQFKPYLGYC